jgi:hypothetical protein
MSFATQQIAMTGSAINGNKYKLCHYCEEKKLPEGGIQLTQRKWVCAACWVDKMKALRAMR